MQPIVNFAGPTVQALLLWEPAQSRTSLASPSAIFSARQLCASPTGEYNPLLALSSPSTLMPTCTLHPCPIRSTRCPFRPPASGAGRDPARQCPPRRRAWSLRPAQRLAVAALASRGGRRWPSLSATPSRCSCSSGSRDVARRHRTAVRRRPDRLPELRFRSTPEHLPSQAKDDLGLPDAQLGLYAWAMVSDHLRCTTHLVFHPSLEAGERARLIELFEKPEADEASDFTLLAPMRGDLHPTQYRDAFDQVQAYIQAGDCYQINLTQRFRAPAKATRGGRIRRCARPARRRSPAISNWPTAAPC